MPRPGLLLATILAGCVVPTLPHPGNFVADAVPPVPAALAAEMDPYLNLGGAGFKGWDSRGRAAIVSTRVGGASHLHRMTEALGRRIALTRGTEPVKYGWFQPGGTRLAYLVDKGGDENFQLMLTADAGAAPLRVTDGRSRNTGPVWSPDGRRIAWASNRRNGRDSDLIVIDVKEPSKARTLVTGSSPGWSAAGWSPDSRWLLARQSVGVEHTRLHKVDLATGGRTEVTPAGGPRAFTHVRLAEKGRAAYALSTLGGDFLRPVRIDLEARTVRAIKGSPDWDCEELEVSEDGTRLAVIVNVDGRAQLRCWELPSGRPLQAPSLRPGVLSDLAFRPGSHEVGFTLNSEDSPSDAWSADLDTGKLTRWTDRTSRPKIEVKAPEPATVRVQSFDGEEIPCLVYLPDPDKFPGRRPAIMIFHGGPEGQSRPGFRGGMLYYLDRLGVALIYPNVRGSSGYGRRYLDLDNGVRRGDAVKDVGPVLDWAAGHPRIDPARIAAYGGSYGGFMCLASLAEHGARFRCGVDVVGVTNIVTMLEQTSDYRRAARRAEYGDERKQDVRAALEAVAPARNASRIRTPLLVVHGRNDPRVPLAEAVRIRDAVRAGGGEVWYLVAEDEGHGFSKKPNADHQARVTALFLKEHLLGP
ncbi:MAG: S9 family peptidase [Opitutales bacterium]